jgi:hypothetical protein
MISSAVPARVDEHATTNTTITITTTTKTAINTACLPLQLQPAEQAPILHKVQLLWSFW